MPRSAAFRSAGRGTRRDAVRRKTTWISAANSWFDLPSGDVNLTVQFASLTLQDLVPFTITRIVGTIAWATDADFASNQPCFAAFGMSVVKDAARAAGTASMPQPLANLDDDVWWYHRPLIGFTEFALNGDLVTERRYDVDGRAQRKVVDGEAIVGLLQSDGSSSIIQVALQLRILCKLH